MTNALTSTGAAVHWPSAPTHTTVVSVPVMKATPVMESPAQVRTDYSTLATFHLKDNTLSV